MINQIQKDDSFLSGQEKQVLKNILEKYNLLDKINLVENLIKQVIIGEITDFDIDLRLISESGLDLKTAATIGLEISEQIIAPVKEKVLAHKEVSPEFLAEKKSEVVQAPLALDELGLDLTEKEIKKLKMSSEDISIKKSLEERLDETTKKIKENTGLEIVDEILKTRYRNIITSFLKEVRDEVETRQVLKRPQKIGGMELDEPTVNQIIKILKEEKTKIIPEIPAKKEEKKPELAEGLAAPEEIVKGQGPILGPEEGPTPEVRQKFEFGTIAPPVKPAEERLIRPVSLPFESSSFEREPVSKKIEEPPVKEEAPAPVEESKIIPTALEKNVEGELGPEEPVITVRRLPSTSRPKVEEVKVRPRVYGPIDELRNFHLADWKRLGGGKEAAERIFDKIQLLGEESLSKKAQGVQAWKQSEVNQLYLEIGVEAIDKGKTVEETIRDREREGRTTLSFQDFEAVGELNQKLRF